MGNQRVNDDADFLALEDSMRDGMVTRLKVDRVVFSTFT
jgi:hypothetical protein